MRGIKPGRVPSWGGVVGGIVGTIFGIFWTITAASVGAPPFFTLFGVLFIFLAIGGVIYNLYNATSSNRFSTFDITEHGEEIDPLAPSAMPPAAPGRDSLAKARFCPYCGAGLKQDFEFCPHCGKPVGSAD